jgi:hypothetical protein
MLSKAHQDETETHRHRCEVRHCIRMGATAFKRYIDGIEKHRCKERTAALYRDVVDQAKKGNKGETGTWL